jgi:ATP-dependent Clp protease ATP-binding subunit ClpC
MTPKAIFKKVDIECEKLNDNVIDSKHVILAILSSKLPINDILSVAGINYNSFNKKLKKMTGETPNNGVYDDSDDNTFKRKIKPNEGKSKTPVLDNFCRDISKAVDNGEIDPVIGRKPEIKELLKFFHVGKTTQYL